MALFVDIGELKMIQRVFSKCEQGSGELLVLGLLGALIVVLALPLVSILDGTSHLPAVSSPKAALVGDSMVP